MNDFLEQLKERAQGFWSQFQESSTYASIREKIDTLSPRAQKAVKIGAGVLLLMILFWIPWTYISSSFDEISQFEAKKSLLKELFITQRQADAYKSSPLPPSGGELQNSAQARLATLGLGAGQVGPLEPYDNASSGKQPKNVPAGVQSQGFKVSFSSLNLRQVVEIGYQLQSIDAAAKLVGMEIKAVATNPHYFDVVYKVVSFAIPLEPEPLPPEPKKGKKGLSDKKKAE